MSVLCIWGETRADVLEGYAVLADKEGVPARITWRLAASFSGKRIGQVCYAPKHPEIEDAYGDNVYRVKPKKAKGKGKGKTADGKDS